MPLAESANRTKRPSAFTETPSVTTGKQFMDHPRCYRMDDKSVQPTVNPIMNTTSPQNCYGPLPFHTGDLAHRPLFELSSAPKTQPGINASSHSSLTPSITNRPPNSAPDSQILPSTNGYSWNQQFSSESNFSFTSHLPYNTENSWLTDFMSNNDNMATLWGQSNPAFE